MPVVQRFVGPSPPTQAAKAPVAGPVHERWAKAMNQTIMSHNPIQSVGQKRQGTSTITNHHHRLLPSPPPYQHTCSSSTAPGSPPPPRHRPPHPRCSGHGGCGGCGGVLDGGVMTTAASNASSPPVSKEKCVCGVTHVQNRSINNTSMIITYLRVFALEKERERYLKNETLT